MNNDEIRIGYFHESLRMAHHALYSGLLIASIAYFTVISKTSKTGYEIPFINVEVTSLQAFTSAIIAIYMFCGFICAHALHNATQNWNKITDENIARCVLDSPNLFFSNYVYRSALYSIFFTIGALLIKSTIEIEGWRSFVAGTLIATPYFYAFRSADYLREKRQ